MSRPLETPLTVLKFGSSVLRADADLAAAVHEVYRWVRRGHRVVAVVSAQGDTTDALLARARAIEPDPTPATLAALLATGEDRSSALLALACERAGLVAVRMDARDAGLVCAGEPLDATPTGLDRTAFERAFRRAPVVVLPGFVGVGADGEPRLFGRGGSDLTALFVAHELFATRTRLVKDVDGIFERDPNRVAEDATDGRGARRFARITWRDAERVGGSVVQPKAVRFAAERGLGFEVAALGSDAGTQVGELTSVCVPRTERARPLRVALAGLGTVGSGVLEHLLVDPERFEVVGALVRDLGRAVPDALPANFLVGSIERLLEREPDVLVELAGGVEPAGSWCERALESGVHVVTANKALLAESGRALAGLARARGLRLAGSAAVGGAVPMLETARRLARSERPTGFDAVLNGTTNHVLDALAGGASFGAAVADAKAQGFAEADPTLDLDGTDAAQKLELLAAELFPTVRGGVTWLQRRGIDGLSPEEVRAARDDGRVLRLVATCHLSERGPVASVRPVSLDREHPLAGVRGAGSALLVHLAAHEPVLFAGRGAGRWPTAEAVLADLFELCRGHQRNTAPVTQRELAGGVR